MKQFVFYCLALITLASCDQVTGSGNIITEKRDVADFRGISVGGAFEVELKNGPRQVVIEADDNLMNLIQTDVSGNTLKIRTKGVNSFNNTHLKIYITAPDINSIESSGASHVKIVDQIRSPERVSFEVSGAGSINGSVDAPAVDADISGAGNIDLTGRTKDYLAKISGSGTLRSSGLQSENADVDVSGAGNASVNASVSLKAEASGAGTVTYRGGGSVQQRVSGAGTVKSAN